MAGFQVHECHYYAVKEAIILTMQSACDSLVNKENIEIMIKMFNTVRNMIEGRDMDAYESNDEVLDTMHWRIAVYVWKLMKRYDKEIIGPTVYKNMFENYPHLLEHFGFK